MKEIRLSWLQGIGILVAFILLLIFYIKITNNLKIAKAYKFATESGAFNQGKFDYAIDEMDTWGIGKKLSESDYYKYNK